VNIMGGVGPHDKESGFSNLESVCLMMGRGVEEFLF